MQLTTAELTHWLGSMFWPFVRIAMMFAVAPIFGGNLVPMRVKLILALLLTWVMLPLIPPVPSIEPLSAASVLITLQQMLIGLAIGFAMQLVFTALIVGGQTVAMGMGLGFASMVDPQNGVQVPVIGQYYLVIATLLFLVLNGHLALISVLADSFQSLPIGNAMLSRDNLWEMAAWASRMFAGGVLVALPAVTAILLVNLSFGVVSRSAPQLNIFGVGFPVTLVLGFLLLLVTVPGLLPQMNTMMLDALAAVQQFGRGGP
jgi:flagellar biosynthetic protein FliR